jgi:two-component system response regulator GlrR
MGAGGSWRRHALAPREEIWDGGGSFLAVAKLRLDVIEGHDAGSSRVFGRDRIVIGSHESADFVVRDSTVSRMHCELVPTSRGVVVRDLGSKNGTAIHGIVVREVAITRTAVLELGHTKLRISVTGDTAHLALHDGDRLGPLIGQSAPMRRAFALAEAAAALDTAVLIEGEGGTGKRSLAATIHEHSARAGRPILVLACSATPSELLERELFGCDGAMARPGAFEAASGGSVVLDQVGELPIELQPRLLGVLDSREVRRVGSERAIPVDVRVIATTDRNLAAAVNGRRFRSDLHARLAATQIALPPLRARPSDLPLLVADLTTRLELDADDRAWLLSPSLLCELATHHWPGNLRELRSYVEGCLALRARATPAALPPSDAPCPGAPAPAVDIDRPYHAARGAWIDAFDRSYAGLLLRRHDGDIATAARAAGLDPLALYHLLWRLGVR